MIPSLNKEGNSQEINISSIVSLLCYQDPVQSELAFLMSDQ